MVESSVIDLKQCLMFPAQPTLWNKTQDSVHVSTHLFIYICGDCFSLGALSGGGVLWLVKPVSKGFPFLMTSTLVAGLNHTNTYIN